MQRGGKLLLGCAGPHPESRHFVLGKDVALHVELPERVESVRVGRLSAPPPGLDGALRKPGRIGQRRTRIPDPDRLAVCVVRKPLHATCAPMATGTWWLMGGQPAARSTMNFNFTDRVRHVLAQARLEAIRLEQPYID